MEFDGRYFNIESNDSEQQPDLNHPMTELNESPKSAFNLPSLPELEQIEETYSEIKEDAIEAITNITKQLMKKQQEKYIPQPGLKMEGTFITPMKKTTDLQIELLFDECEHNLPTILELESSNSLNFVRSEKAIGELIQITKTLEETNYCDGKELPLSPKPHLKANDPSHNDLDNSELSLMMANLNNKVSAVQKNKDEAVQIFQDKLFRSRTVEMNKEIEIKTKTFKKLAEQKIELDQQINELEIRQNSNLIEHEYMKGLALHEKIIMNRDVDKAKITLQNSEHDIEKAKITFFINIFTNMADLFIALQKSRVDLANKEKMRENATARQLLLGQQIASRNNKVEQEIGSLKAKKMKIEKEQADLHKKEKVNEGLVEHLSNMIEDKIKDLTCPVCFETAETPVYQCTEGHLICKECLPSLKICPECRAMYPKTPFRNRFAEKMVEEIVKLSAERKALLDGI